MLDRFKFEVYEINILVHFNNGNKLLYIAYIKKYILTYYLEIYFKI